MASSRQVPKLRLASVSFLNAKPLLQGISALPDVSVTLDVPSRLIDRLADQSADVALLPVIDYQSLDGLRIVPAGGIGCDGPTLTVRLFSKRPIDQIEVLACDTDSHTSVALAKIILAESYGIRPRFVPLGSASDVGNRDAGLGSRGNIGGRGGGKDVGESLLLIGDKVICEQPIAFDYQLDLGEAWKTLTDLPFVFAVWTARGGVDLRDLPGQLEHAKRLGLANVDALVRDFAVPRGWPADVARLYMTEYLKYDIGEPQLMAIRRFHALAAKHGLIATPPRPLRIYEAD